MCGIIGVFNNDKAKAIVAKGLKVMENRGKDSSDSVCFKASCLGHNLHAIVDLVKQPICDDGKYLIANCEIYNWKEINQKHELKAKNDAEMLLKLINLKGIDNIKEVLLELDGVYAFCYYDPSCEKALIARDLIGEKPIWVSYSEFLAFASEKKALSASNIFDATELNPRKVIVYDVKNNEVQYIEREFFEIAPENGKDLATIKKETLELIKNAVKKRLTDKKIGVLFSGGIDSVFIAFMLKQLGVDFTCYTAALEEKGMGEAEDLVYAQKAAKVFGFKLKVKKIALSKTESYIKKVISLIETTDVMKVGVAMPFYIACENAKKDKIKVMFSGLGSEEIFAGYERHLESKNVNLECLSGLLKMYERDLYRDDVVTMANSMELRLPLLDTKLVDYAVKIPAKYKISNEQKKIILRMIAEDLGIPKEFSQRKKKAAQYGSKFDRAIEKLTKKKGFNYKHEYLNSFSKEHNLNLGVMWSGGKDSCYAAYLMKRHNYNLKCLLTMKSKNKYSFMFHTPNIDLAEIQSKAMGIPILIQETRGEKEDELEDMKKLLAKAKKEYNIDGVVTGALFSQYQRERIEKAADELGLKIFSPLWHKNQKQEMLELLDNGFRIVLSSVAADGLDEKWLGKVITAQDVEKLDSLNKKIGLNIAGEGGEYESFVLDSPLFRKEIIVKKSKIVKEGKHNAFYVIEDVELKDKELQKISS